MTTHNEMLSNIQQPEYDFIRTHPRLGNNIVLLGLGGSRAYGTDTPDSDWDWRGIALNPVSDILLGRDFEQVADNNTDTVIYSFNKMIKLLSDCNPNTIEILGLRPEHHLVMSDVGREMVANADMFLSKIAKHKFGAYAQSQLRKLCTRAVKSADQTIQEKYILGSIKSASELFPEKYAFHPDDAIKLFIDASQQEGYESEIFMDINLSHYPLRDWCDMWAEMQNIAKSYNKLGMRNKHAIEHGKLSKHQCHLARLYMMGIELLRDAKINTYRDKDHDFLMDIRAGKYLGENNLPTKEFMEMVREWDEQLEHAAEHSPLPDKPEEERINRLKSEVNYAIVASGYDDRGIEIR